MFLAPKTSRRGSSQLPTSSSEFTFKKALPVAHSFDFPQDSDNVSNNSGYSYSECNTINLDDSFNSGQLITKRRLAVRRGSSSASNKPSYRKTGKIIFSTEYNEYQNILRIHVQQAVELAQRHEESEMNTFVRLYLEPGKKQKQQTRVIRGNKEPVFEEMTKFNVEKSEIGYHKVKLKVYNSCKLSLKNELLGEANLFLSSLDTAMKETFSLDLLLRKSEVCASVVTNLLFRVYYLYLESYSRLLFFARSRFRTPKVCANSNTE